MRPGNGNSPLRVGGGEREVDRFPIPGEGKVQSSPHFLRVGTPA